MAHTAEHAVNLETGAIVGVTVQDADEGDTTTSRETLIEAAEQVETVQPDGNGIEEVGGDKGYHSNQSQLHLGTRSRTKRVTPHRDLGRRISPLEAPRDRGIPAVHIGAREMLFTTGC